VAPGVQGAAGACDEFEAGAGLEEIEAVGAELPPATAGAAPAAGAPEAGAFELDVPLAGTHDAAALGAVFFLLNTEPKFLKAAFVLSAAAETEFGFALFGLFAVLAAVLVVLAALFATVPAGQGCDWA
jgi:hypothetical protein